MRIALMSSQQDWGGGEQYLWSLGQGLIDRGHHILWVAPPDSVLAERIEQTNGILFRLGGRKPSPVTLFQLRNQLIKEGTELLHANDSHAVLWGSLASIGGLNIRRIGMKHTVFPIRSSLKYNWCLDKLVCVSRAVRELCAASGIASQRLEIIHGGIEPPAYDRLQERSKACRLLKLDPGVPLLSAVGSLLSCKGFDTLIEAAKYLRNRIPEFCIAICGEGPMRAELEQKIRSHALEKHVRLLGFQQEPNAWIAASDVFVHPTRSEGLSLVTIAAQMIGTPVVATEVGGLREVMRCRDTSRPLGWIYASECPIQLAELLEQSLSQVAKRRSFARDAHRSAIAQFHLQSMIDGFEGLYTSLVGNAKRSFEVRLNVA